MCASHILFHLFQCNKNNVGACLKESFFLLLEIILNESKTHEYYFIEVSRHFFHFSVSVYKNCMNVGEVSLSEGSEREKFYDFLLNDN